MSWFARIEESCAAFIERAFAKTFPSDLEPSQIARKLVSTMEARTDGDDRQLRAPDTYEVYVNPADFERLAPHRDYLQREWSALLSDMAERVGIGLRHEPQVTLFADDEIVAGAMEIDVVQSEPERARHKTPAPARYVLRMVKGVPPDAVFALGTSTRVGRSRDREIFLVDPSVSRNHAVVETDAEGPVVRDLGSTNGTFVNGERVADRRLRPGDVVAFGNTQLRCEASQA